MVDEQHYDTPGPGKPRRARRRADLRTVGSDGVDDPGAQPPTAINWNLLDADTAAVEWVALDAWVSWLRKAYGLSVLEIPPLWHRHDELVWELSALHLHWLACYGEGANPSAPMQWHKDFRETRTRLREWVAGSGTQATSDRPTRIAVWPGDDPAEVAPAREIADRDADFAAMVREDVQARQDAYERGAHPLPSSSTGSVGA